MKRKTFKEISLGKELPRILSRKVRQFLENKTVLIRYCSNPDSENADDYWVITKDNKIYACQKREIEIPQQLFSLHGLMYDFTDHGAVLPEYQESYGMRDKLGLYRESNDFGASRGWVYVMDITNYATEWFKKYSEMPFSCVDNNTLKWIQMVKEYEGIQI